MNEHLSDSEKVRVKYVNKNCQLQSKCNTKQMMIPMFSISKQLYVPQ